MSQIFQSFTRIYTLRYNGFSSTLTHILSCSHRRAQEILTVLEISGLSMMTKREGCLQVLIFYQMDLLIENECLLNEAYVDGDAVQSYLAWPYWLHGDKMWLSVTFNGQCHIWYCQSPCCLCRGRKLFLSSLPGSLAGLIIKLT